MTQEFFRKNKMFMLMSFVIFLCATYSLGAFDSLSEKSVVEREYRTGGFTYTGKLLNGKFHGEGKVKLDDSEYSGTFKDGLFDGDFTYINHDISAHGTFLDGELVNCEFKEV